MIIPVVFDAGFGVFRIWVLRICHGCCSFEALLVLDVGLIMFSPKGRSITFASGGRVEDIFIRWIAQAAELTGQGPICDGGYLTESLKHLKCEQEMLEKIERSGFSSPLFFSVEMIVTHTCFLFSGCFCLINSLSLSLSSC
ncbi:uncharacterized protein LOC132254743 isoform X2 [Vitis vinifera]|uniref:uncharacterized protein LOC132254743 isoform X2 n=1 Tax=Vitis vinifera TaxID=29760 RepID=UPI00288331C6|nr:uncharacterized protein LOC132254743 isoform X2 [Vitis vinifera]